MPDRKNTPGGYGRELNDSDLGGDYARDTHRGGLGDDYAREEQVTPTPSAERGADDDTADDTADQRGGKASE